jgi:hypothetical protein
MQAVPLSSLGPAMFWADWGTFGIISLSDRFYHYPIVFVSTLDHVDTPV